MVDAATGIDVAERSVVLSSGGTVAYDYLIYAVGSGSAKPLVPGAAEFAYPLATLEEAQRLRPVLDSASATAAVTVVGAGALGIEVAAELAEVGRTVTLVCGGVFGPYLHPRVRRAVVKRLAKLGVTVLDGPDANVTAVARDAVQLSSQAANPLGAHAANTVLSRMAGEQPALIDVGFFGLCVSLGRRAATVQLAANDDTANRFSVSGRLAVKIKESSYTGLIEHLVDEARKPGSYTWKFKDAKRAQRLQAKHDEAPAKESVET